jgi:hypothetical protein
MQELTDKGRRRVDDDVADRVRLGLSLDIPWTRAWERLSDHIFRLWTAGVILAAYGYAWVERPELLTWWKRTTTRAIEQGCGLLPYPWGDRIEATLGNFGLWVQITLAIVVFRFLAWLVAFVVRWACRRALIAKRRAGRAHRPDRAAPSPTRAPKPEPRAAADGACGSARHRVPPA